MRRGVGERVAGEWRRYANHLICEYRGRVHCFYWGELNIGTVNFCSSFAVTARILNVKSVSVYL